jgi:hypothetical protein
MATINGDQPKITIYTNHRCPYAHRSHIVLKELGLKHEEVFIDLDTPREPWYLEINPVSEDSCALGAFSSIYPLGAMASRFYHGLDRAFPSYTPIHRAPDHRSFLPTLAKPTSTRSS